MNSLAEQAWEARMAAQAVELETWLRANPEIWPQLRRLGMWCETLDRIEGTP